MEEEIHMQMKDNSPSIEVKMEEETHVQVKDKSPSIECILRPISYAAWFLGVGIAHPRKCPKAITITIHIVYMILHFFLVKNNTSFIILFFDHELDIAVYLHFLSQMIYCVSTYYYIYHGIRQYNKWPKLMDKLKDIDQKIKKEISMNDRSIKIVVALAVFATFISYHLIVIFHFLYCHVQTDPRYFTISVFHWAYFVSYYISCQWMINSFVFDIIVYVLYCRFQTINKLICQLDKSSDVLWIAFKIRGIRKMHTDICDLVNMVNDIYSLHLLFCLTNCFTMTVNVLFQVYILDIDNKDFEFLLVRNFDFIAYVTQFYLICLICTLACQESNKTGRIIYEIILNYKPANLDNHEASNLSSLEMRPPLEDLANEQSFNRSHNLRYGIMENLLRGNPDQECLRKEINDFSIQLQQNRIAFTACNFFEINNGLFTTFVEVIVTYLVVVGQLYQQPKDLSMIKELILKTKNQTYSHN